MRWAALAPQRGGFIRRSACENGIGGRRLGVEQFDAEILIQLQHAARHGDNNVIDIVVAEGFAQHAQVLIEIAVG